MMLCVVLVVPALALDGRMSMWARPGAVAAMDVSSKALLMASGKPVQGKTLPSEASGPTRTALIRKYLEGWRSSGWILVADPEG